MTQLYEERTIRAIIPSISGDMVASISLKAPTEKPMEKAYISEGYLHERDLAPRTYIIPYDATKVSEYYKYLNYRLSVLDYVNHYDKIYRKFDSNGTELFSLGGYMPYKPYKKYVEYFQGVVPYRELIELKAALESTVELMESLAISAIGSWNVSGIGHISNHRIILTPFSLEQRCLDMANNPNLSREAINELKRHFDYHAEGTYYKSDLGPNYYDDGDLVNGSKTDGLILEKKYHLFAKK